MQTEFATIVDAIAPLLRGDEVYTCSFTGEESEFVRFNGGAVRQAGAVTQRTLTVDLIEGRRHASGSMTLSGDPGGDRARLAHLIAELRAIRGQVADDPYLHYAREVRSSERRLTAELPAAGEATAAIQSMARHGDLVGIYAAGAIHSGFANAFGQRNWDSSENFNLDWSFFHAADKAVKGTYAGTAWNSGELARKAEALAEQLTVLRQTPRPIPPGGYRVYLTPAAVWELLGVLGWGGFGLRAHRTKTTPLLKMIEEGARLHPSVSLSENTGEGIAPGFQEAGFIRPSRVQLIAGGAYRECLVSPRSALEYGVETNGASAGEAPSSIDMAPGSLARDRVLAELGTGIYVGNLWYLNFSDRAACRTTGMTRFATFWVDGGVIQAPIDVMRFDETVYRLLGENLVGLTAEREFILDPGSYFHRSTDSARLPGVLVDDFTLTL
ncbi:MAG TPA: metallopeptidase TldD-related protein [Candidatus Dormibacteraeota bacterium]|nr:metallopeptidase TldD-related protein [Candidatus Dormibacteraeota bacterium]